MRTPASCSGSIRFPESSPSRHGIVVQSAIKPDWDYAFHNAPELLAGSPLVKPYQPSFAAGQRLRFRLRANPTKKVASLSKADRLAGAKESDGDTKNGRRLALLREDDQVAWLLHKGEVGGFRIPGQWIAADDDRRAPNFRVDVIPEGWVRCGKDGHSDGRFFAVRFEGLLEVIDPKEFCARSPTASAPAKRSGLDSYPSRRTGSEPMGTQYHAPSQVSLPTHVGVNRGAARAGFAWADIPHARGGEPGFGLLSVAPARG